VIEGGPRWSRGSILPDCSLPDCSLPDCFLPDCSVPDCSVPAYPASYPAYPDGSGALMPSRLLSARLFRACIPCLAPQSGLSGAVPRLAEGRSYRMPAAELCGASAPHRSAREQRASLFSPEQSYEGRRQPTVHGAIESFAALEPGTR